MFDIIFEVFRALIALFLVIYLWSTTQHEEIRNHSGFRFIMGGFIVVLFGMLIDITDNFPSLNYLIIIGDTPEEAFLEKVVGGLLGFILLAIGFWKWVPTINKVVTARHQLQNTNKGLKSEIDKRTAHLRELADQLSQENKSSRDMHDALLESEKRWQFALEGSGDGVWDWRIDTDTVFFSSRWKKNMGYDEDETGLSLVENNKRIHPDDQKVYFSSWEQHLSGQLSYFESEHRVRHKDGRYIWVSERAQVIERDENQRAVRLIGACTDITERKQTESMLQHSQKMQAIENLTSGIAHDFNNMLGIVIGNLDLLEVDLNKKSMDLSRVHNIKSATQRAAELTKKLLSFSRYDVTAASVVDINQVIAGMHALIEPSLDVSIQVVYHQADDLWPVYIDKSEFESVLLNLVVNAGDAMSLNGLEQVKSLVIRTGNYRHESVLPVSGYRVSGNDCPAGDYVQLVVSDTGAGISEDQLAHIFEPFFTTKSEGKGTGLGLAMVFSFIKHANGFIQVDSTPGSGTIFNVFLPRIDL